MMQGQHERPRVEKLLITLQTVELTNIVRCTVLFEQRGPGLNPRWSYVLLLGVSNVYTWAFLVLGCIGVLKRGSCWSVLARPDICSAIAPI